MSATGHGININSVSITPSPYSGFYSIYVTGDLTTNTSNGGIYVGGSITCGNSEKLINSNCVSIESVEAYMVYSDDDEDQHSAINVNSITAIGGHGVSVSNSINGNSVGIYVSGKITITDDSGTSTGTGIKVVNGNIESAVGIDLGNVNINASNYAIDVTGGKCEKGIRFEGTTINEKSFNYTYPPTDN